ncbi:MAG: TetR family transcriptional regulator [Candidatus Nanopelagicales bacterium]|nr:TetR family transcriptional regulator [Candidatus Nanopelagicales bacterium]MCU0296767.1 TetR family transcriptional regulator [Candidatus Nanopelagicales bacterium]MCU0297927.1 TetR family transcriptional regulator [Candidatus Nanopelagicales bacterium]
MGTDDVRDAVLDAARAAFHARGYVRTSMKGVAVAAGVAPEVVNRYWNSKESLFAAAMRLPFDPASAVPELVAPGLDGMGERLTRATLDLLSDEQSRNDFIALFQAGASATKAAKGMQDFIERSFVDRLVRTLGVPDARLRVNLIVSYLIGVATTRYIVRLEPVASMPEDDLVKLVAPTIQNWLDPTKPLRTPKSARPAAMPKPASGG